MFQHPSHLSSRTFGRPRLAAMACAAAVTAAVLIPAPMVLGADPAADAPPHRPGGGVLPGDAPGLDAIRAAGTAVAPAPPPPVIEVLATVDGVELLEPAPQPVLVGFHQANGGGTRTLQPGTAVHQVLPSRGRGTPPASAVDIVLEPGEPVRALTTGTVVAANTYSLYGRTSDVVVEIAPDGRPDLRVRMLHMDGLQIAVGQHVVAGDTVIAATARVLPFGSQVDRVVGERLPHVHVEVVS